MKKALLFIMAFLMVCGSAFSQIEPVEKLKIIGYMFVLKIKVV